MAEVVQADGPPLFAVEKRVGEKLLCILVNHKKAFAHALSFSLLVGELALAHLYIIFLCQPA